VRCIDCQYPLDKLAEHRCPECGRAFDPDDPRTYAKQPTMLDRLLRQALIAGVLFVIVLAAFAGALYLMLTSVLRSEYF
jgi:hypothetical protein